MSSRFGHRQTRRQFLARAATATAAMAGSGFLDAAPAAARAKDRVILALDSGDAVSTGPPVQWATQELRNALEARGLVTELREASSSVPTGGECILVAGRKSALARGILGAAGVSVPAAAEALALARGRAGDRSVVVAGGADARGLVYALLELADRVTFAEDPLRELRLVAPVGERPANSVRSIARLFVSDVEDKPWFNDRGFWRRYLTLLAAQRFNRFSLMLGLGYDFPTNIRDCYFHFAYPFLVSPPGYAVRAEPLADSEREHNLAMLRFLSGEAARRGLDFQLGLWTHAYRWTHSPHADYVIRGLTPATHAVYCRDALEALLRACPAIAGVTFRTHGESGVPEGSYGFWRTVFDGVVRCGRSVGIDLHAKGLDQTMIEVALATGMPVTVSPKFWAEHMGLAYMQGSIRPLEMPPADAKDSGFFAKSSGSRRFLRYGYGDLLAEGRRYGVLHRIWPGTQRLLLWGNPALAAGYGRASSFCGSVGVELCEPLSFKGRKGSGLRGGREAYADASLRAAGGDFAKYTYTYRLWGRCIYNPDCEAEVWRRVLRRRFGAGAGRVEEALEFAGRILPLVTTAHCPSAANNNYWPELYTNMPIVDPHRPHPYFDTPSPKRLGTVSPLDPEFFSGIDEFAEELLRGGVGAKYSPAWVASQLAAAARLAGSSLHKARSAVRDPAGPEFRRVALDVMVQRGLGGFFAWKFRAGVLFALYRRTHYRPALEQALKAHRRARQTWSQMAEQTGTAYAPDITFGYARHLRGHWRDRLEAIDVDIADMERLLRQDREGGEPPVRVEPALVRRAIHHVLRGAVRGDLSVAAGFHHAPPKGFMRNRPLAVNASFAPSSGGRGLRSVRLRYRRVNQAELWRTGELELGPGVGHALIPAAYTDSPFPLQYYFELHTAAGDAWLYPGLPRDWQGQPYFVVRQTGGG
jgi:hypothetical protein